MSVKLYANARDRKKFNELADLYAIVKAMEHLEVAYARDAIGKEQYTEACSKLLGQFKGAQQAIKLDARVDTVHEFLEVYKAECPRAMKRIHDGVPATLVDQDHSTANTQALVAETVSNFITVIDALKLGTREVDELTLVMVELMSCLNRAVGVSDDFQPKRKVHSWVTLLGEMGAHDSISEEQARQLELDIQTAYSKYFASLGQGGGGGKD